MGYLDELKKQAEQVKAEELSAQREAAQKQALFREQVLPGMLKIHRYLRELAQNLNYIKPATPVNYVVKGPGTLENLLQADYLVSHYNEYKNSFFLRCVALTQQSVRFAVDDPVVAKAQHDYLWSHNIRFDEVQVNDANGHFQRMQFTLDEGINIEFDFSADYETSAILLEVRNFEQLGRVAYRLTPDQVTDAFLDDFAHYITRQPDSGGLLKLSQIENVWALTQEKTKQTLKLRREQASVKSAPDAIHAVGRLAEEARQRHLQQIHEQKLQEELAKARALKEQKDAEQRGKSLLVRWFGSKK